MIYQPLNLQDPIQVDFYEKYFSVLPESCTSYAYSSVAQNECDVYVITFNNPFMVEYQVKTLRKLFKAPFNLIVVDNNNWLYPETSAQVLELCIRENVTYLKAPDNYYQNEDTFDPTMKLGTTMNWIYTRCVRERKPKYFGILDHDCFLVRPFDIRPYLDQKGMYGRVEMSKKDQAWTLHVVVNFFRFDFVQPYLLDFRASYEHQLDTGGANWDILYKNYNAADYMIDQWTRRFADQDVNRRNLVQHYEVIDNVWYHMCASTHDQKANDGFYKLAYTKGYLDAILGAGWIIQEQR